VIFTCKATIRASGRLIF